MKLILTLIGILAACVTPTLQQRPTYNCVTPENYYGTCVTLTYCPQIANVFQTLNRQTAQQYVLAAQRSCGTRSVNRDPVVCCTRPQTNVRPTSPPPVTSAPNPFFPTPPTRAPVVVQPTQPPVIQPTPPVIQPTPPVIRPTPPPATSAPPITQPPVTSAPLIDNSGPKCRSPDLKSGFCIELTRCPVLLAELQVKQTDDTFKKLLRASNSVCGGTGTLVCCPSSNNIVTNPTVPLTNTNEIPRRLPTVEEGCGYTSVSYKKIVGGENAKKGAYPWIVLVGYNDELSASPFKCGGTLVTARHVVTAAHCNRRDLTFVRLGEHDLSLDTEANHVDIPVVKTAVHPDYNTKNGRSDIAVLYLQRNVVFSDFVRPICIPTTPELRRKSYVKYTPFVAGWGKTMEGGRSANILQQLQILVFDNSVCKESYRNQGRLFSEDQFDAAIVCAGVLSGGQDTCQGDSGGPLMIPEVSGTDRRYYLMGVVSYGIGCARPDIPGVYTSVQYFADWIQQQIANTP